MTVSISNHGSGSRMRADRSVEKLEPGTKEEAGKIILRDGGLRGGDNTHKEMRAKTSRKVAAAGEVPSAGEG